MARAAIPVDTDEIYYDYREVGDVRFDFDRFLCCFNLIACMFLQGQSNQVA